MFVHVNRDCCNLLVVSLGTNIKRLRAEAGIRTQRELAARLEVPQPQVSDWENDRYAVLETLTLVKIAKGLGCSVDALLAGVDPAYDEVQQAIGTAARRAPPQGPAPPPDDIPVIAEGDAPPEDMRDAEEAARIVQWTPRPGDLPEPGVYGVRIRSDSMLPAHRPPMVAIASAARPARDGDEAYVQLVSGECFIRRVHKVQGGYMLQSYNQEYPPRFVKPKEVRAMHAVLYSRRRNS